MRITKTSNFSGVQQGQENAQWQYKKDLDGDINKLVLFTQGRVRLGSGVTAARGENISGEFRTCTTSGTPNAENTIPHTIGSIPIGYIVIWQDKAGSLYQGPSTGTAWTSTNLYLKCSVASVTFNVFLLK